MKQLLIICSIGACCIGCTAERNFRTASGLDYILDMEDASRITAWTLEQNEVKSVADGLTSLGHIVSSWNDQRQREDAATGYEQVYAKIMKGWPALRPWEFLESTDIEVSRAHLKKVALGDLRALRERMPHDALVNRLWQRLSGTGAVSNLGPAAGGHFQTAVGGESLLTRRRSRHSPGTPGTTA